MKVTKKILQKIKTDNQFSLDIAKILDISQVSVWKLVKSNSTKLTLYALVEYYRSKGFTDEEIFEQSKSE